MTDSTISINDMAPVPVLPPSTVRAAALTVCLLARDHADARLLLDALGLIEDDQDAETPRAHLAAVRDARPMWPWVDSAVVKGAK